MATKLLAVRPEAAVAFRSAEGGAGQPGEMRRRNVSAVLRAVVAHGPLPRVEIADLTSLSGGSVTRITGALVRRGLLRELPGASGGRQGAPRVPLDVAAEGFAALGVHLGQRRANIGLVDLRGRLLRRHTEPYGDTSPEAVARAAAAAAHDLLDEARRDGLRGDQSGGRRGRRGAPHRDEGDHAGPAGAPTLLGTGVSVGGWVDARHGVVVQNPGLGWRDVPLRDLAAALLPGPLYVDSTYRGFARAELCLRAASRPRDFLLLFLGNAIGAALVVDGALQEGFRSGAGSVGHLPVSQRGERCGECGRRDCFVAVAGDRAVIARAAARGLLPRDASDEHLVSFVRSTAPATLRPLLRPRARAVGEIVSTLAAILDPQQILLSDPLLGLSGYTETLHAAAATGPRSVEPERIVAVATEPVISAAIGPLDGCYDDPLRVPAEGVEPRR